MRDNSRHRFFAHMPIVRDILNGAAGRGASLSSMCNELNILPADLTDSSIRVPFHHAIKSWQIAVRDTNDPLLGLHLGEKATPAILGMVGYLMHNSATLLESFHQVAKYAVVATNMFDYRVRSDGDKIILQFVPLPLWIKSDPASAMQAADQAMAGTLNVFYLLSGVHVTPVATEFTTRSRKHRADYERVFPCAMRFDKSINQLIFTRRQLQTGILSHDRSLFGSFEKLIKKAREKTVGKRTRDRVRHIIMSEFGGQLAPIEAVATHMNLTVRSLQRKLSAEHTSFRDIVAIVGKQLSTELLRSKGLKVKEIAAFLGYSDARAFRTAYKSWTGRTPR